MPAEMVQAIRLHEFGGPDMLPSYEVPVPEPQPGEVIVRVHAVGRNPSDLVAARRDTNIPEEMR